MTLRRRRESAPAGYHQLLSDLKDPGCPVCRAVDRAVRRYLDALFWESVNDPYLRPRLRAAHGFCREHAVLALSMASRKGDGQGIAILYRDFLGHLREEAIAAANTRCTSVTRRNRYGDPRVLAPHVRCSACDSASHTAEMYVALLARAEPESEIGRAVRGDNRGLCVPHLIQGIAVASSPDECERLLDIYLRGDDRMNKDLDEYLRKQDYRYRHEGLSEDESSSWRRAVYQAIGGW